jgi:hypothetical protein
MNSKRQSLAMHTFGGVLQSDITCACGNVSSRLEPFMDLSIDVGAHHHAAAGISEQRGHLDDGREGVPSIEPGLSLTFAWQSVCRRHAYPAMTSSGVLALRDVILSRNLYLSSYS